MAHITKIIKYEALSSGQIAVTIRCDADPSTDFPITLAVEVAADVTKRTAALSDAAATCAKQHQAALDAATAVISMVGSTVSNGT